MSGRWEHICKDCRGQLQDGRCNFCERLEAVIDRPKIENPEDDDRALLAEMRRVNPEVGATAEDAQITATGGAD